jgi:ABC-type sulfate/molybdate transport systems ATPase subunit
VTTLARTAGPRTAGGLGCRDLRVTAGGRPLLHVPHLDAPAGVVCAVLGPNGAGKSTLLRALAGLGRLRRTGEVLLDGAPATRGELRAAVAAVLQRPVLRRGTVAANAATGLRLRGAGRAEARQAALPWLRALGIAHLADRDARTLSGGEVQRVALARALAVRPRVLLLDEPFTGLDHATRADLLADLAPLLGGDVATVLVTHDRQEAAALAGRAALLVAGELRQAGPVAEVLDRPADADCARVLGYTNLLPPALTGRAGLLAARPEHTAVHTGSAGEPELLSVRGVLRRVVPLGTGTRLDLRAVADGTPLSGVTTADVLPAPGAVLTASVAEEHLRSVPG